MDMRYSVRCGIGDELASGKTRNQRGNEEWELASLVVTEAAPRPWGWNLMGWHEADSCITTRTK
jgi:hypothetical protein